MKKIRMAVVLFFVMSCICYGAYGIRKWERTDHHAPEIYVESPVLKIPASAPEEELFKGVTAADEEDGDRTAYLQVASLSPLRDDHERTVRYIVFDEGGLSATASRTICYTDYESPKIYLTKPLLLEGKKLPADAKELGAKALDCIDGDISDRIRMSYGKSYLSLADTTGPCEIILQVNNSAGDTRLIPLTAIIADPKKEEGKVYPVLSEYLVYKKTGEVLKPREYLQGISFNGQVYESDTEQEEVSVPERVVYTEPGIYKVEFSYTTKEAVTAVTILYVVVED